MVCVWGGGGVHTERRAKHTNFTFMGRLKYFLHIERNPLISTGSKTKFAFQHRLTPQPSESPSEIIFTTHWNSVLVHLYRMMTGGGGGGVVVIIPEGAKAVRPFLQNIAVAFPSTWWWVTAALCNLPQFCWTPVRSEGLLLVLPSGTTEAPLTCSLCWYVRRRSTQAESGRKVAHSQSTFGRRAELGIEGPR